MLWQHAVGKEQLMKFSYQFREQTTEILAAARVGIYLVNKPTNNKLSNSFNQNNSSEVKVKSKK